MRYYFVVGEASGDIHAANLMRALRERDADARFRFWGGDRMAAVTGENPQRHIRELNYMGFWEVAKNLRTLLALQKEAAADVLAWKPDALVLVDYPGFNLPLAAKAQKAGLRVFWYIAPQVWAWKANRVQKLKARVERLYAILPFEQAFFAERGMDIDFVGHPLLDHLELPPLVEEVQVVGSDQRAAGPAPHLALLPGSRPQELKRMLPLMLDLARRMPDRHFRLAAVAHIEDAQYHAFVRDWPDNVALVRGHSAELLRSAEAAVVTSGTATLECALIGTPQVVVYKGGALNVWLARRLIQVPYIALPNLVMDQPLVPELIQGRASPEGVQAALVPLLQGGAQRRAMREGYAELRERLGGPGASARTAERLWARLKPNGGATPR
jgi:lipid-A-disaccharide synthase